MILVDTNIFMYAAGSSHEFKKPSIRHLHDVAQLEHSCCVNAEIFQEILHRYRAINRWQEGREVFHVAKRIVPTVEPITAERKFVPGHLPRLTGKVISFNEIELQ